MFKKIILVVVLLATITPINTEAANSRDIFREIKRTTERITSQLAETPSYVKTLHPETTEDEVYLAGRVEELNDKRGRVFFEWGENREMKNRTEPEEITSRGRFVRKLEGLETRKEPFYVRVVLTTKEGNFYGDTVTFGLDYYEDDPLEFSSGAVRSVYYHPRRGREVLLNKNQHQKLGLASVTKLMTALVALENYDLTDSLNIEGIRFSTDRQLTGAKSFADSRLAELFYPLLLESSNGLAYSLSIHGGRMDSFIEKMNQKASDLGMRDTEFKNPSGLDGHKGVNRTTAYDLTRLMKQIIEKPFIGEVLRTEDYVLESENGDVYYTTGNTNLFLTGDYFEEDPSWVERIWGGKTGWTYEAGGALVLVLQEEDGRGYYINALLDAPSQAARFRDMEKLISWIENN